MKLQLLIDGERPPSAPKRTNRPKVRQFSETAGGSQPLGVSTWL
jgi:hypothetical protein